MHLPIRKNADLVLGESQKNAVKKLNSIWSRLNKNQTMTKLCREFMEEYQFLGHMKEITLENSKVISYFIPHQAVYRPEKIYTPLSIDFDASTNTSSGYSLNSMLFNDRNNATRFIFYCNYIQKT